MTEITETPTVVRDTVTARLNKIMDAMSEREAEVARLTLDLRIAREALVRAQIEAEDLTIWLERNGQ